MPRFIVRRAVLSAALLLAVAAPFGCNDDDPIAPEPAHGTLRVDVFGAPIALGGDVTVTGPAAFSRSLATSAVVDSLVAGNYSVAAEPVSDSTGRWEPTPDVQTRFVELGDTASATVTYALATARLALAVGGLPPGTAADLRVTGPGGYDRAVTATTRLDSLVPGEYVVTAQPVRAQDLTWRPTPAADTVVLTPSTVPLHLNVTYTTGSGMLDVTVGGLPNGTDAAVTVTGPEGFSLTVRSSRTLANLDAGTYTISATGVTSASGIPQIWSPQPRTQTVAVAEGQARSAGVTYAPLVLALEEVITTPVPNPVFLTAPAGDPRLFVVEQGGRVRIIKNGQLLSPPFLDIAARIQSGGEEGLLSIAFAPNFATSGHFYAYFTDSAGNIAVERFHAAPGADVANPAPTRVITIAHPFGNHNGGLVTFGPDGMLYLGTGDGGGGGDPLGAGQNLNTLLGKILRLDVSTLPYTVPASNPFVGQAGARPEIWAYGLRNPWRFELAPVPGAPGQADLYVADVGQGNWEEIDLRAGNAGGANFGWSIMEGAHCYPPGSSCNTAGLVLPVLEYDHSAGDCSITGGFVYRGAAIPDLAGHYFYSDYCGGWIASMIGGTGGPARARRWLTPNKGAVLSFGRDAAGELYVLFQNGAIYRIVRQP